jgi:membrane protease YdiL (CAAX protease family)
LTGELKDLWRIIKQLDRKIIIIFISVAVLQTVSYYYTSRRFFRYNYFEQLQFDKNVFLYEYIYWFVGDFLTLFILPLLIIKFLLKGKLTSFGFRVGDYKIGLKYSLIFLVVMIPIVWFVSANGDFIDTYPQLNDVKYSWNIFLVFESGILLYMIAWEFMWRGFMLFGLEEKFGYYAVLIQMIPFLILHNGKPAAETFGAIVAGLALGILALKTRSVLYCIITHAGIMFSIDLVSTLRFRSDEYGTGLSSLIKIFKIIF